MILDKGVLNELVITIAFKWKSYYSAITIENVLIGNYIY